MLHIWSHGRTHTQAQEKDYNFTLEVETKLVSLLVPGAVLSDVSNQIIEHVNTHRPDLADRMTKVHVCCVTDVGLFHSWTILVFRAVVWLLHWD